MSLRVGNTFCKGKRTTFRTIDPRACAACVFGERKGTPHTCGKEKQEEKSMSNTTERAA